MTKTLSAGKKTASNNTSSERVQPRTSPAQIRAREIVAAHPQLPPCKYVSIVQLRAQGLSNAAIGERLAIHPNQVSARMPEAIDWILSGCPASNDRRTWGIYRGASTAQTPPPQAAPKRPRPAPTAKPQAAPKRPRPAPTARPQAVTPQTRPAPSPQRPAATSAATRQAATPKAPPAKRPSPPKSSAPSAPKPRKPAPAPRTPAQTGPVSDEHRFSRLLGLLEYLAAEPATAEQLGRAFKTTERTIQRDVNLLRKLGFTVESKGRGKGFFIANSVALPVAVAERVLPPGKPRSAAPKQAQKPNQPAAAVPPTSRLW